MVSSSRIEGGTQVVSAQVRKTIQSIKEIVEDHSEADIYTTLKEANMDPNEAAQKLLNQDPFHEVKRKRDKKKETVGHKDLVDPQRHNEDVVLGKKIHTFSDHNGRRANYPRNALPGINRGFRIVRDNRVNQNSKETKPNSLELSASNNEQSLNVTRKGVSPTLTFSGQESFSGRVSSQLPNGPSYSQLRNVADGYIGVTGRKDLSENKHTAVLNSTSLVDAVKPNASQINSEIQYSRAVGVYSSASDPVHVPSPDSRSSAPVGAIKREVGVVGVRQQSSDGSGNHSSLLGSSLSNSLVGRDVSPTESFRPFVSVSKVDQPSQTTESVMPSIVGSKAFLSSQHSSRHQQHTGHQKSSQPNKEWKPKASQKSSMNSPGVIGTLTKPVPSADESKDLTSKEVNLQDKLSRVNINENQNVIIAQHIRVSETDRCQLIFGSFGTVSDHSRTLVSELPAAENSDESNGKPAVSLPDSSTDDASGRQVDFQDNQVRITKADSSVSVVAAELQLPDKRASSSPQDLSNYADIEVGRDSSPTYPTESYHQTSSDLSGFSAYDQQTGYDIPYFRPTIDDRVRIQGLPFSNDSLISHSASMPASTFAIAQQQQQQQQQQSVAQMYPQVHLSHFANLMPYRQYLSPVYVPPMAMPGYSSNPAYPHPHPHPSNGSSYLLMPGGNSHLNASNLKYGMQQFKTVPAGSPTGFGNFSNPSGYAINSPSLIGGANGLEDSSRIKYKDGNLYVPNPQAETSEIWVQNPREVPNLQSTPYYSMAGQAPHAAYLPAPTGHASFNAAAAASQSSHMQFPGLYHPSPQPPAMANPHHIGTVMAGSVGAGVGAATPSPQVGAYQPPQLGHLNWTANF